MQNNIEHGQKIAIVHIIISLSLGGAEMMLYNLLGKTDREKFEPIVISMMDRGTFRERIEALGIPVYTLDMQQDGVPSVGSILRLLLRLRSLIHKLEPDIIQGWMYHANIAAQLASLLSLKKVPICWGIHHSIASLASEKKSTIALIRLGVWLSGLTSQIVFVSETSRAQHQAMGYAKQKSQTIPNGFDTNSFVRSPEHKLDVRAELGIPPTAISIGLLGRYHPMKDHANFINAAALLVRHHPHTHFLLIGEGVDRDNTALTTQIAASGLSDRVHLLGRRNDIARLSASLDICSLSSAYGEAFPLVIGEAMSCEVPCVVTDVGDSAWIVSDTGRVVPTKNPQALAAAWQEIIELDAPARAKLGIAARQRIVDNFSLESIVERYEKLYAELV
jgi:glycosyltransferase involved in cell wall biosynthesis